MRAASVIDSLWSEDTDRSWKCSWEYSFSLRCLFQQRLLSHTMCSLHVILCLLWLGRRAHEKSFLKALLLGQCSKNELHLRGLYVCIKHPCLLPNLGASNLCFSGKRSLSILRLQLLRHVGSLNRLLALAHFQTDSGIAHTGIARSNVTFCCSLIR